MIQVTLKEEQVNKKEKSYIYLFIGIIIFLLMLFWFFILRGPKIDKPIIIHISRNENIKTITQDLENKHIVQSAIFLESLIAFFGADNKINPGDYYFEKSISLPKVAYRFARGIHNIQPIKITIPEGSSNNEIAIIFSKKLPNFDMNLFLDLTKNYQGQLFPDTYFFYPLTTMDEIIDLLKDTFNNKTKNVLLNGYKNYTQNEILTMASIVEEEAKGNNDRDIIAGILWKRLENKMLLQVDAVPSTYKILGLPIHPITNSGLASIEAVINPKETPYFFYLHDKDGMIHLAKNFTEHKANIKKYIKK